MMMGAQDSTGGGANPTAPETINQLATKHN